MLNFDASFAEWQIDLSAPLKIHNFKQDKAEIYRKPKILAQQLIDIKNIFCEQRGVVTKGVIRQSVKRMLATVSMRFAS